VTLFECATESTAALTAAGFAADDARRDATLLIRHLLGWTAADWIARGREPLPEGLRPAVDALTSRRARHEPVAYLTGVREFFGRDFRVTPDVLIPRPETEGVAQEAMALAARAPAAPAPFIVDVGTGSGCLAVTLSLELPQARVLATDVSAPALDVARSNARRLGAERVDFVQASLLPAGLPPIDFIVSNPPYVRAGDRDSLPADVRDYEPAAALFAGEDGLEIIRGLVDRAAAGLRPGGGLVLEIGAGQAEAVAAIVSGAGLRLDAIHPDLQGIPRVVVALRPQPDA
jgi:release factor glutamine methyltransferase